MTIKVGDRIPSATLEYMSATGPVKISSDELFAGKRVAAFAVPGAFTPTCSQEHLPGYVRRADSTEGRRRKWPDGFLQALEIQAEAA